MEDNRALMDWQQALYDEYRISASTPMELRDIAIVLLGLRMGMRSVDICKLMISDISWKDQTISFVQQKTGVFVALPMPTDVGNSLYRYIIEGRPWPICFLLSFLMQLCLCLPLFVVLGPFGAVFNFAHLEIIHFITTVIVIPAAQCKRKIFRFRKRLPMNICISIAK